MTRYDPDLIAALAAGELAPAEAAALERHIAADPRAAAELKAQRRALHALREAPAPVLSAEERTELRRAVSAALHLEPAAAAEPRPRRVPWRPLAVAAAALAALAVAVPLVALLSVGGNEGALTTMAQADLTARSTEEDADALIGDAEQDLGVAPMGTGADPAAQEAVNALVLDPARLIAAADPAITACAQEARSVLGTAVLRAAPTGPADEWVVWFATVDGPLISKLAVFDPDGCRLMASAP